MSRLLLVSSVFALAASATPSQAYNILALDFGAYWNRLDWQHWGAQEGYGAPDQEGERWYTQVHYSNLQETDLSLYDVLFVPSGFLDDYVVDPATAGLEAMSQKSGDIASFLMEGGGVVAMAEPFSAGAYDWAPLDFDSEGVFHENTVEVADPHHEVMEGLDGEALSDWHSSWHGYFTSWDPSLSVIARTGDYGLGDVRTDRALTLAGEYGCGRMVFTLQDADYHAWQDYQGARDFLGNATDWAAMGPCEPVPEPKSLWLLALALPVLLPRLRR